MEDKVIADNLNFHSWQKIQTYYQPFMKLLQPQQYTAFKYTNQQIDLALAF